MKAKGALWKRKEKGVEQDKGIKMITFLKVLWRATEGQLQKP